MKTKSLLLTAIFSLLLVSGALAQEKYEYAIVKQSGALFTVSTKEKAEQFKHERGEDLYVTLLKKVSELNDMGWEVYNNTETTFSSPNGINSPFNSNMTFYLRKKK